MSDFVAEQRRRSNAKLMQRIRVVPGDITKQDDVDAIVSAIKTNMDVSGSLNQSLIKAAGHNFDNFILENIYKPKAGDVYAVPGFNLPVEHVLFVVTPPLKDTFERDDVYLLRSYRQPLKMAANMKLKKIAFPALGTGKDGYPPERAARLAIRGIMDRMSDDFAEVRIVCDQEKTFGAFSERLRKYAAGQR